MRQRTDPAAHAAAAGAYREWPDCAVAGSGEQDAFAERPAHAADTDTDGAPSERAQADNRAATDTESGIFAGSAEQDGCAIGVLLCAGSAARMGFDKLTRPLGGRSAIERSFDALLGGGVAGIVFAVSETTRQAAERLAAGAPVPCAIVQGGATRQESVKNALEAIRRMNPPDGAVVAIHDAARCMVAPEIVRACIESAGRTGSGIAAVPVADTVFRQEGGALTPVPREGLFRMQTPQAFRFSEIRDAYARADGAATDDATLYRRAGYSPTLVMGSADNEKLTTPADWARAERMLTRYGTGFDTHRLVEGRKLILGGVDIPFERGLLGHSDADVLLHAVMDALLGAAALPDIGHLFPDSDPAYAGADSMALLGQVVQRIREKGMRPLHIDATIIAQRPKMAPHIDAMRGNIAAVCGICVHQVGVKATTTEGMNDEGRGLCISAQAIASVV